MYWIGYTSPTTSQKASTAPPEGCKREWGGGEGEIVCARSTDRPPQAVVTGPSNRQGRPVRENQLDAHCPQEAEQTGRSRTGVHPPVHKFSGSRASIPTLKLVVSSSIRTPLQPLDNLVDVKRGAFAQGTKGEVD
jgi:hypothetical protein